MNPHLALPRIYPIVDAAAFSRRRNPGKALCEFTEALAAGGAGVIQYRNKQGSPKEILRQARKLRRLAANRVRLVMNDRADLCLAAGFNGVHVGQRDLSVEGTRRVVGTEAFVGVSTHNLRQVREANRTSADYVAIGPVFKTHSKENPDPVVGLKLVRAARKITHKPLVAIGGITRQNCRSVIEAGADAVAVISDLLDSPRKRMEEFRRILG